MTLPVFGAMNDVAERIFQQGGALLLVFAALLSIWDVSGAVRACMSALNEITRAEESRPTVRRFAVSIALAVVVILLIGGAALLLAGGAWLAGSHGGVVHVAVGLGRWLAAASLLWLAVAAVVKLAPVEHRSKRWATAGSALIVVAWLVASTIFRWFVASVANFKSPEGTLAAFLALTTYLYILSIIFMVGAQLDELLAKEGDTGLDALLGR